MRQYIISNYKHDPTELVQALGSNCWTVYQQSDMAELTELAAKFPGQVVKSKHTGHNITDYLLYIINNYHQLPAELGVIKGNIFPRHLPKEVFLKRIGRKGFIPLYSEDSTWKAKKASLFRFRSFICQQAAPGFYLEKANDWYIFSRVKGKYFPSITNLYQRITGRAVSPEYLMFVPGACMIIEREKILRWPIDLYKELYHCTSYSFFPVEAYHLERLMLYLFLFEQD